MTSRLLPVGSDGVQMTSRLLPVQSDEVQMASRLLPRSHRQPAPAYACTLGRGAINFGQEHLPDLLSNKPFPDSREAATSKLSAAIDEWLGNPEQFPDYREISGDLGRILIDRLLTRFDGKIAPMASALEANRTTIRKKLSKTTR